MTRAKPVEFTVAHIRLLSDQVDTTYQAMKTEREAIARWEESQSFSILGVLELFSSDIQGYAESLSATQMLANNDSILSHLRKLDTFQVDYFADWYFENWSTYPQVRLYVEQLDHLRLLLIEYLRSEVSIAA